ncbi:DNA primase/helicase [Mycobacterium phage Thibault]|uniref:DNA primase/helicase n=1 Tax=Mycobacterium phage Thibault TaxID=1052673 RepID=G1FGJ6_9CAUD|nr:DNA helicase [Mycobacterium phage Thibault]AEJ94053.1 DNA primase/helicase [Mycobacterium phage Thibault]
MEGTRNSTLFQASANLSEFVNAGTLNENVARDALMDAARQIGLMDHEIEATIDSGFNKTVGKARAVPERKLSLVREGGEGAESPAAAPAQSADSDNPWGDFPPIDGAEWMFNSDTRARPIWGTESECLWASGESLMLAAPPGLGKSTLAGRLVRAQLGLQDEVLGLPVVASDEPILYLAADRPKQLQRSMLRQFSEDEIPLIAGRLFIRPGPPINNIASEPGLLLRMAQAVGAGTVYIDSVKDFAIGLSSDEVGALYNQARQWLVSAGVEVCELHHMKKVNADSTGGVADVYGSTWLTSGTGSVIVLSGEPGDLAIRFRHVRQPADEVGPFHLLLNPDTGDFSVRRCDLLVSAKNAGPSGLSAEQAAMDLYETRKPRPAQKAAAERQLDKMVTKGLLVKMDSPHGGPIWYPAERRFDEQPPARANGMF